MGRRAGVLVLALALFLGLRPDPAAANSQGKSLEAGAPAPQFTGVDLAGNPVDLAALAAKSRAVLVNFWGLRCGACLEEMPHLEALHEKHGKSGLVVIGVNVDGVPADLIRAHLPRIYGKIPPYTILPDEELKVADLYKLTAAPLSVLVDSKGKIAYYHEGYAPGDEKELGSRVEKLLAP